MERMLNSHWCDEGSVPFTRAPSCGSGSVVERVWWMVVQNQRCRPFVKRIVSVAY